MPAPNDAESLSERLDRLERQHGRWRRASAAAVVTGFLGPVRLGYAAGRARIHRKGDPICSALSELLRSASHYSMSRSCRSLLHAASNCSLHWSGGVITS